MVTATAYANSETSQNPRRVSILGSTGSIGRSTLDLIGRNLDRYHVVALTGNTNAALLAKQAIEHGAELAVLADPDHYQDLKAA